MRHGIFFIAVLLLITLLISIRRQMTDIALLAKTLLSALFVLTALMTPHPNLTYSWLIIIGLTICLIGDICLAFDSRRAFMAGLAVFLAGHLVYVCAFFSVAPISLWTWGTLAAVGIISSAVFIWLAPHLGAMRIPVLAYISAITLMVTGALSLAGLQTVSPGGRSLIIGGAVFFYLSDLFVARQQFVRDTFLNRAAGLPLYYLGQFLLALSVGRFG